MQTLPQSRQLLRLKQVEAKTGYKSSTLSLKIKKGEFPAPISLGARAVAWDSESIDAWIESRIEAAGCKPQAEIDRLKGLSDSRRKSEGGRK